LGVFNASARHLLADLGRRISINTGEAGETSYLFLFLISEKMLLGKDTFDFLWDDELLFPV